MIFGPTFGGGRGRRSAFVRIAVTAALLFILKIIAIGVHTKARHVNPVSSSAPAWHFYYLVVFSVLLTDGDLRYVYGNYPSSCFIYFICFIILLNSCKFFMCFLSRFKLWILFFTLLINLNICVIFAWTS